MAHRSSCPAHRRPWTQSPAPQKQSGNSKFRNSLQTGRTSGTWVCLGRGAPMSMNGPSVPSWSARRGADSWARRRPRRGQQRPPCHSHSCCLSQVSLAHRTLPGEACPHALPSCPVRRETVLCGEPESHLGDLRTQQAETGAGSLQVAVKLH